MKEENSHKYSLHLQDHNEDGKFEKNLFKAESNKILKDTSKVIEEQDDDLDKFEFINIKERVEQKTKPEKTKKVFPKIKRETHFILKRKRREF